MVSKKILGVAIAAAFVSQTAFAAIDGVAANNLTYAKETILTAQVPTTGATAGLLNVVSLAAANATTAGELSIVTPLGFGVSAGSHAFVRFDLTNAKFNAAIQTADLFSANIPGANIALAQGGAVGDTYVIFDITSPAGGLLQTESLTFSPGQITNGAFKSSLAVSTSSAVSITYNHYSTSPSAVLNSGSALSTKAFASAVSVAEALKVTFVATDRVADVTTATPFTTYVSPASATASLGSIQYDVETGYKTPLGVVVTNANASTDGAVTELFDAAAAKSSLVVTGDFSFTGSTTAALTAANVTFGGTVSDTAATNVASGKLTNLTAIEAFGAAYLVSSTATAAINAGTYSLTFTPAKITAREFTPTVKSAALGTITRNGATIQVPYLSTNTGLNQKVVLVNRSSLTAPYKVSYTTETGVTATNKLLGTETLAPGKTLVIKASDLVTLVGGTRTAATITVTAPATSIDAATQTVVIDPASVSFGSNDTVVLTVK